MAIYKRCQHRGRERDRCAHPWYGTYQLRGNPRVRVSLAKWGNTEVKTKGEAQAVFDDVKTAIRAGTFDPRGRGVVPSSDEPMTFAQLAKVYEERYVIAKNLKTAGEFKWRVKPLIDRFWERWLHMERTSRCSPSTRVPSKRGQKSSSSYRNFLNTLFVCCLSSTSRSVISTA